MLDARDPLHHAPRRVLVAGVTGSGKTTLARRIAASRALPYVEIDALFHGENWTPRETFATEMDEFTSQPEWITEWQYPTVRQLLVDRADTLVWLDHSVPRSLGRLIRRTVKRSRSKEILWNGNIEPPLHHIFWDEENIIRWAFSTQFSLKKRVPALEASHPHLQIVRLTGQRQVERWFDGPLARAGDGR